MCGLAGFAGFGGLPAAPEAVALDMANALIHRGPDDAGIWVEAGAEIALAHRRLSIVDLSPAGHQPMRSASGHMVLSFNGEIYNHGELRQRLDSEGRAPLWRGSSDTEVLLEACEAWGVETALRRCRGMFAFALFDAKRRILHLARDRVGEKPLYFGRLGRSFVFASELKAITRFPGWTGEIDPTAVATFVRTGNVPGPQSIYKKVFKLTPASLCSLNLGTGLTQTLKYWDAHAVAEAGLREPFAGSEEDAEASLELLLKAAVADQMVADVPLGAFLSGGIDSSTVVALMQSQSARKVQTFSIGFHDPDYDEAKHARRVAAFLGTDHTELYVSDDDALAVIPRLPQIYDEPFADVSQIPTFLLSKLARQKVTVSLSGDGGDELFCGYSRYEFTRKFWPSLQRVPHTVRKALASFALSISPKAWDIAGIGLKPFLPSNAGTGRFGELIHKSAHVAAASDDEELYGALTSRWHTLYPLVAGAEKSAIRLPLEIADPVRRMMLCDLTGYLPDDVLTKVDRAAMAVSLETRVPMLDHRVVEFSWTLPDKFLFRKGKSKWLLRRLLSRHLPAEMISTQKRGFAVPIGPWLRGGLRPWAEDLLCNSRIANDGLLDSEQIRFLWQDHLSGKRDNQYALWNVLMLNSWLSARRASASSICTERSVRS